MATIVDRYVDTASSGGDGTTAGTSGANAAYSSITAALADIASDFPSLVTSDVVVRLHCAGGDDTLSASPTAWSSTTDLTRFLEIFFTGNYRIVQSNASWNVMAFSTNKVVLHDVNLLHSGSRTGGARGIDFGTGASDGWYEVDGGQILCTGTGTPGSLHQALRCTGVSNPTIIQRNLVTSGWGKGSCSNSGFGGGRTLVIDNCTVTNCVTGITCPRNSGDTILLRNNVCQGNTTDYVVTGSGGTFTHAGNISEDATSPDAALASTVITFEDQANGDYHLSESGTAADESGTDLSGDTYGFTTDKDGVTRTAPWSSGAYEAVSASPPQNVTGSVAITSWTGLTAAITAAAVVTGAVASGAWALPAPTLASPITITATAATAAWTANDASITLSGTVTGSVAIASWMANDGAVSAAVSVAGTSAISTGTLPAPTVTTSVTRTGAVAIGTWTAVDADVAGSGSATGSAAVATWTMPAPSITAAVSVVAAAASSTWTLPAASLTRTVSQLAGVAVASWTAPLGTARAAATGSITAVITSAGRIQATLSSAPRIGATITSGSRIVRIGSTS